MILTQAQLAIELGLTDRHLRRWKAEGLPSIGEGRKAVYDLAAVCAWMVRTDRTAPRLEEQMARLSGAPGAAPAPAPAPAATPAAELEPQAHGGALLRFVPPAAPPPPPGQLGPPPEGSAELAQGVLSRRRAWRGAQLALEGVDVPDEVSAPPASLRARGEPCLSRLRPLRPTTRRSCAPR